MKTGYEQYVRKVHEGWQWLGADGERDVCATKRDALAEAERSHTGIHQSLMPAPQKTPDLFPELVPPKPPRKARQHLMHVVDAGDSHWSDSSERPYLVVFECTRCKHETDWQSVRTITEAKKGAPCPKCN